MKELYLEIFSAIEDDGICVAPLETVISLFTLIYCDFPPILLTFVVSSNRVDRAGFKIKILDLLFDVIEENEVEEMARICRLPVIVTCEGTTVVAGLCAVLRHVVKAVDPMHSLLGFKQSCLYACAESSIWTRYCEVDIVETVNFVYLKSNFKCDSVEIPEDVVRFEFHMSQPVRIHNIQKQKRDLARSRGFERKSKLADNRLDLVQELEHSFSEGPEMTLADVILFPCFFIIFENLGSVFLKQHLPLSHKWYETMLGKEKTEQSLKLFTRLERKFEKEIYVNYVMPKVEKRSLCKRETRGRIQSKRRFFTRQENTVESLKIIEGMKISIGLTPVTFGHEIDFDLTTVPADFRLDETQIPTKRLERKGQQLENMAKAVLKIAKNEDRIVDFCSGSGHLGLILAHALPRCSVILLENKEQSLERARERAAKLKLSNIIFCQSNVDYFKCHFDVGTSLHACGVATDLVIERCIEEKAAFVCCPCCYGSIQSNHVISYPRSEFFRKSMLNPCDYFVLGHSSDQTHGEENAKTDQGNRCMIAIDSDRCLRAKEAGYAVVLSKLDPPSCTPKNNLLVGMPKSWKTETFSRDSEEE